MNIWIVVPTKPFTEGKTRLADALTTAERKRLNRQFFARTLGLATNLRPARRIIVATRSEDALSIASDIGALSISETENEGLNEILTRAAQLARAEGADGVLSLSCDLPFLETADIEILLGAAQGDRQLVIAGDRGETGTNAMLQSPPLLVPYRYGPNSFATHYGAGCQIGLTPQVVRSRGLAFDVDTPEDLKTWRRELSAQS